MNIIVNLYLGKHTRSRLSSGLYVSGDQLLFKILMYSRLLNHALLNSEW